MAGVASGVGLTLLLTSLKNAAARLLGEHSGAQILISLLIPFGCYLVAERLGGSGVLAAVAGGLTMAAVENSGNASATVRIPRNTFWDVIGFAANGVIFVLLGEQLHGIVQEFKVAQPGSGLDSAVRLGLYAVAITAALAALRFAWGYVSLRLRLFRRRHRSLSETALHDMPQDVPLRLIAVMSLAGVRGAVSLAGVLGLPLLLHGWVQEPDDAQALEEDTARVGAARAAMAAIENLERDRPADHPEAALYTAAAARLLALYRTRIDKRGGSVEAVAQAQRVENIERELRLVALRAERSTLFRELRVRRLGSRTARKLVRELDLMEARQLD